MSGERDDYREREPPAHRGWWAERLDAVERRVPLEIAFSIVLCWAFFFLMCGGVLLFLVPIGR